jgi:hypothetical protein
MDLQMDRSLPVAPVTREQQHCVGGSGSSSSETQLTSCGFQPPGKRETRLTLRDPGSYILEHCGDLRIVPVGIGKNSFPALPTTVRGA